MKVLVTGSEGFIASHLLRRLDGGDDQYEVYTLDIRGTGDRHFQETVTEFDRFDEFDRIYHLAAISDPGRCEEKPGEAWKVNVEGTRNVARQLGENQQLMFASSAKVYGTSRERLDESSELKPDSFYGFTKKVAETVIEYYSRSSGFDATVFRFFNTYGPGQDEGFLVPDVVRKAMENEKVEASGAATKISPVFIGDVAELLVSDIRPGTFNVAHGEATVGEIYREICQLMNTEVEVPEENGAENSLYGVSEKLDKDWTGLEEGLRRTVEHYGNER